MNNETQFKIEYEKIKAFEDYFQKELFKRNDLLSKDLSTSIVLL
jgi:hypothetical protein